MSDSWRKSPSRAEIVAAQYGTPSAVAGYIEGYRGWTPEARNYYSRFYAVDQALRDCSGGDLLDVGCGPGMLVEHLRQTRPGTFTITACDRSAEMVAAVADRVGDAPDVRLSVAKIDDLPYPDANFDVVTATGVLEYVEVRPALREVARVLRPGGVAVLSILNPRSMYRMVEWGLYWPARRALERIEAGARVPPQRRHGVPRTGIEVMPAARLSNEMDSVGLTTDDTMFYDVTPLVPPLDKALRPWLRHWRKHPEKTVARGRARGVLGSGYVLVGRHRGDRQTRMPVRAAAADLS